MDLKKGKLKSRDQLGNLQKTMKRNGFKKYSKKKINRRQRATKYER